jgi:hypothetical protein
MAPSPEPAITKPAATTPVGIQKIAGSLFGPIRTSDDLSRVGESVGDLLRAAKDRSERIGILREIGSHYGIDVDRLITNGSKEPPQLSSAIYNQLRHKLEHEQASQPADGLATGRLPGEIGGKYYFPVKNQQDVFDRSFNLGDNLIEMGRRGQSGAAKLQHFRQVLSYYGIPESEVGTLKDADDPMVWVAKIDKAWKSRLNKVEPAQHSEQAILAAVKRICHRETKGTQP